MTEKFYLTTPIYYVNARPHIGTTYTTVVADVIARRKRALGVDTYFLTGTDEHGQKIQRSAEKAGCSPQEFTDKVAAQFRALWDRMGLTYDDFIRTTEPRHVKGVQKLFMLLKERGFIYKGSYTGQYCVSDEAYVDVPPGAPCPECGRITETVNEENYFFKLSAFERTLLEFYEAHPEFIRPETRRNEVISFVRAGLKDYSVTRTSITWGIPFPGDEKHVIYVWNDALANYITALGWGSDDTRKFDKYWPADLQIVGKEITRFHCVYWPAMLMAAGLPTPKSVVAHGWLLFEESKMSKSRGNIVRAETILEGFGGLKPDLPKPEQDLFGADVVRYFLLREIPFGQDGSFSFDALVQRYNADLANGYGNLVSRTLTMIGKYFDGVVPEGKSSEVPNADYFDRVDKGAGLTLTTLPHVGQSTIKDVAPDFERFRFSRLLETIWVFISLVDGELTSKAPWKQVEGFSAEQMKTYRSQVLYEAAESIRIITALVYPVIPDAAGKVWAQLGLGEIEKADLKNLAWGGLKPGTKLGAVEAVFPRAEKDAIARMKEIEEKNAPAAVAAEEAKAVPVNKDKKMNEKKTGKEEPHTSRLHAALDGLAVAIAESTNETAAVLAVENFVKDNLSGGSRAAVPVAPKTGTVVVSSAAASAPVAPAPSDGKITIDDFSKVELRVAQIKVAERVPKADKLLRLEVDLGYEQRQILAGIAEAYAPESLVGRKIVIVANLAPRKLRGLESNGMLLAASLEGGKPVLAGFLEDVEIGARLK